MRIHRLTVTAFGPFPDEVDVDLDDLTDSGLFLVHGPTGAGKTSLLDAVCFALYAGVPGARDRGPTASLRSHHAADGVAPRVVLDFTAAGRRLRITRSPAWTRPGRATPVPATVSVEELRSGRWEPAGARHDEVGDVVKDVMGMDRDQFAKVVLLPQGEFAAFLRAGAEDRRKVLERLFDVSTYAGVETWLTERRRSVGARAQTARADADRLRAELAELLARTPVDDEGAVAGDGDDDPLTGPELAAHVETRLAARLAALLVEADAAALDQQRASDRWVRVRETAAARERGLRATREQARLEEASADVAADRARHADAERAAAVRGDLAAAERARRAAEVAATTVRRDVAALAASGPALAGGLGGSSDEGRSAAAVTELLATVRAEDATVTLIEDTRAELERLAGRRVALAADAERKASAVQGARARVDELSALRRDLDAERESASVTARDHDRVSALLTDTRRLHRLRVELDRGAIACTEAADALRRATDDEQAARELVLDLRERRISGMAAELAADLADGPCPVCGSTEHPHPAGAATGSVTRSVIRDAEARHERLLAARQDALARHESLTARQQALLEETGDDERSVSDLAAVVADATTRAERSAAAAARLVELDARTTILDEALAEVSRSLDAAAHAVTATASAVAIVDQQVAEATTRGELARRRHDETCPCGGVERHGAVADLLTGVLAGHELLAARRRDLSDAAGSLTAALATAGFADETSARDGQLDPDAFRALGARLRDHDDAVVRVAATLEDPVYRAALEASDQDVDVEAAGLARREAEAATRRASQALGQAETDHASGQRLAALHRATLAALDPLEDELAVVTEVADAAAGSGSNARRMPLSSYVLAARLERVAALANERLAIMGQGRFELRHTDERSGNARAGLGLEVVDRWTGRERPTATLSGGESFMASLALALALADAVREEAGGLDLQTLFIDEGFGTLDDESLEQVLAVLDGLRDGGRVVGVVSHVADLRTRIPRQVRVLKSPHGSSVEVHGASARIA